jgi:hypothetical protein
MRVLLPTLSESNRAILSVIMEKLLLWLVFNVIIALLPFAFRAMAALLTERPVDLKQILSDGELFLVSAAIASGAVGELILKGRQMRIPRVLAGGGCVICLMLASFLYAFIRAQSGPTTSLTPDGIYTLSLIMFFFTFLAGTGCLILSEV